MLVCGTSSAKKSHRSETEEQEAVSPRMASTMDAHWSYYA